MLLLLQLHLHSLLNTWLHWIGQRQLQDEMRNIEVWGFGATCIGGLTVHLISYNSIKPETWQVC